MAWATVRLTMTGSEYPYTIPANTRSIEFQALDTDFTYYFVASGSANKVTVFAGNSKVFTDPNLSGTTIYLLGTNTKVVEVTYATGLMD